MSLERLDRASAKHVRDLEAMASARLALPALNENALAQTGLTSIEVERRRGLGLVNTVPSNSSRSLASIARSNLLTLFNAVVGGSFLLLLLLGQWKDALFGFAVIANVLIGVIQEFNSKRTLDRIAIVNQPRARVLRDGHEQEIVIADVVLDDVLILRAGDQVPADALVVRGSELEVDESLLTGEADSVEKSSGDAVLSGSTVVGGSAYARTVKVGIESYSNIITREARRFSLVKSELRNALARIVKWISWALIPLMAIALNGQMQAAGGWQRALADGSWLEAVVASIASIISMIPQGLVLITSISFALAAVGLARQQVLVQELPAVEGLARVDVICFDKTGTLTEGEIVFSKVEYLDADVSIADTLLSVIANQPGANATARAMQTAFSLQTPNPELLASIPFNSSRKWSSVTLTHNIHGFFGAPEILLEGVTEQLSELNKRIKLLSQQGNRVVLLATSSTGTTVDLPELPADLVPIALVMLSETVRHDAPETIDYFSQQGLTLKVISGDNPHTVAAVAERAGITGAQNTYDARNLPDSLDGIATVLEQYSVLGRVTPEQKKQIVLALQSRNHVVAMTGDGVNDALALKTADLGIAMGNGSAATKAVSRLVLLDNSFNKLPRVVGEGRRVIANVERVSRLFLTKTTWAMLLAIVFGSLLWTFPFLPRQLSGIDGYTIGIAAFLLALLPNQQRYQPGFLKRSLFFCIPSGFAIGSAVIVFSWIARMNNYQQAMSQTAVAILLSIAGLWVLVTLSRPFNIWRILITVAMYVLFVGMFTIPLAKDFFGFVSLPAEILWVTLLIGVLCSALLEVIARVVGRLVQRTVA